MAGHELHAVVGRLRVRARRCRLPLFLFSASFYPLSAPTATGSGWSQLSPLYHGVVVVRGLNQGEWAWSYLAHVGVLAALALWGLSLTARRIDHLLLK
jgi:lipooligosaccharide transport system permease protein